MSSNKRPSYIKAYEPWSTVFVTDILAVPLTPILAALRVHPNAITVVSLIAGLCTGVLFGFGYWLWGAVVFEFAFLMDCLDGKVARLRGMTSAFGEKLEWVADSARKPSSFLGIAVFFLSKGQPLFAILTAFALIVHVLVHKLFTFAQVSEYDLEFPNFHRRVLRRIVPRLLNLYNFFDEQFIEFVIFPLIAVIVGMPDGAVWFLYGVVVGTSFGLIKLVILCNHKRAGRYDQAYQDWAGTKGNLDKAANIGTGKGK